MKITVVQLLVIPLLSLLPKQAFARLPSRWEQDDQDLLLNEEERFTQEEQQKKPVSGGVGFLSKISPINITGSLLPAPFGSAANDTFTPPNDDGSSVEFELPLPMLFYGEVVTTVYQNTNGHLTFDTAYSQYNPELIPSSNVPPMMAAYWTDIDTRNGGAGKNELWARTSMEASDLEIANALVQNLGPIGTGFTAKAVFVATWNRVESYSRRVGPENTFQIIIAYNEFKTFVIFAYQQLQFFETQTTSSAVVGFNDNQGLEGQLINTVESDEDMVTLLSGTNVGSPGQYAYRVDDAVVITGCGSLAFEPSMRPFYGPEIGGTVLQISGLPRCINETSELYCRFSGGDFNSVGAGYVVDEGNIECLSPFAGRSVNVQVEYTEHDALAGVFDPATATWEMVSNRFQYFGSTASARIKDPNPELLASNQTYTIHWSDWTLLQQALFNLKLGDENVTASDLSVRLQLLAYKESIEDFEVFDTIDLNDISSNETSFLISSAFLQNYLVSYGGSEEYAVCLAQIVASKGGRIGSVKSTNLFAVTPGTLSTSRLSTCPIPVNSCPDLKDPPPCPPNYPTADADPNFSDDSACQFPDGTKDCDIDLELYIDIDTTCLLYAQDPFYCIYGDANLYLDTTACGCQYFHNGAAGCVRNGGSQCCYSPAGALITDPYQGAGTADCFAGQGLSVIPHFITDVIPFILCCKVLGGSACDDYYEKRPPVTSDGYADPNRPGRMAGDPHIRTFDGLDYDFNGSGEYVAYCAMSQGAVLPLSECNPSQPRLLGSPEMLALHLRFAPLNSGDAGTVTMAMALVDPLHRSGESAIAIVPHPTRRFDIFDGSTRLIFPEALSRDTALELASGLRILRTADLESEQVRLTILSPSGLRLEASEVGGVWLPSIATPSNLTGLAVGLLGIPDANEANDLTSSSGVEVNASATTEDIFYDFGQTWMIETVESSLFQAFEGSSQSFSAYYDPSYTPAFVAPEIPQELQALVDAACGDIQSEAIRNGCYFDIAVTGEVLLFASAAMAAVEEEEMRVTVVTNNAPLLSVASGTATVQPGETTSFAVSATDPDSDTLSLTLDRNDGDLFVLNETENGQGSLHFSGTFVSGTYYGQVAVKDQIAAVLFSATVVVEEAPSSAPTPTESPSNCPYEEIPIIGSLLCKNE